MTKDYNAIFKELGLSVMPLDENYNPEIFGRDLMKGFCETSGVLYSSTISNGDVDVMVESNHERELVLKSFR